MPGLYWTGKPTGPKIYCKKRVSNIAEKEALETLADFIAECQRHWIAFNGSVNGRYYARQRLMTSKSGGGASFLRRLKFWERHQRPNTNVGGTTYVVIEPPEGSYYGNPVIAQIATEELINAMEVGGEFEHLNAKALIALIYSLWEESTRYNLANIFECEKENINCELMGDIRLLRNVILHRSSDAKRDYSQKAVFLPLIWETIDTTKLAITDAMIYELMWQLNAIQVYVGESPQATGQEA